MKDLDARLPAASKRPRQHDMLGVLLIAMRELKDAIPAATATYFDIKSAFERGL
jgi:hypothetical protein